MSEYKPHFVKKIDNDTFIVCRETPLGTQRITSCCSHDKAEKTAKQLDLELIKHNKKLSELYGQIIQEGLDREENKK